MKKILSLVITVIMLLPLVACSKQNENSLKLVKYGIQDNDFYKPKNREIVKNKEEDFEKREATSEEYDHVLDLIDQLRDFVNETYQMNWVREDIDVYFGDLTNSQNYNTYNAFYNSTYLVINSNPQWDLKYLDYVIMHELVHYLYELNNGELDFSKQGRYFQEALTDMLVCKVYQDDNVKEFFLKSSLYSYSLTSLYVLEDSMPNLMKYYLTNDWNTMEQEFNLLSEKKLKYSEGKNGYKVENPFLNYLELNDACFLAYTNMCIAENCGLIGDAERFGNEFFKFQYGIWEIPYFMAENKKKAKKEIEYIYSAEKSLYGANEIPMYENFFKYIS